MCAVAQWTCCISSYLRYDHRLITVAWNPDLSIATGGSWQPQLLALQRKSKWDWCYRLLGWQQPACICLYIESSASATENCICKQRRPLPVKFGGGGGRKQRRETQELFNFTFRGRSHDIQPRVEVSYFCTLLRTAGLGTCQHSGGSYIRASFFPGI